MKISGLFFISFQLNEQNGGLKYFDKSQNIKISFGFQTLFAFALWHV